MLLLFYCVLLTWLCVPKKKKNTELSETRQQVLSKTQAHEVVVPWQHEAVAEVEASVGTQEEQVDVEGGESTGM